MKYKVTSYKSGSSGYNYRHSYFLIFLNTNVPDIFHLIHLSGTVHTDFSLKLHKLQELLPLKSIRSDMRFPRDTQFFYADAALLSLQNSLHLPVIHGFLCQALSKKFHIQAVIFQINAVQICDFQFSSCTWF